RTGMTAAPAKAASARTPSTAAALQKRGHFQGKRMAGLGLMEVFCLVMLYAPMFVLIMYAFNDNQYVMIWKGFSWRWFPIAVNDPEIRSAALLSLRIAAPASVPATVFATMAALVTTRVSSFRSLPLVYAIINQPLM